MYRNVVFVVWRESVEALLIVGILNAWLADNAPEARRARIFLWSGVVAGIAVAALLGWVLVGMAQSLSDTAQEAFRAGMVLVASVLILQMVIWMRRHGRTLKRELEGSLDDAVAQNNWWGIFTLALIAIAREGSETAVFLYGILSVDLGGGRFPLIAASAIGFVAALGTYALLQLGGRYLSWRLFFRVTEVMLLLLACALLISGVDKLIELDILPKLSGRLWDFSAIIPDGGAVGGLLANLTGYRARPVLMQLLAFLIYWCLVSWLLRRPHRSSVVAAA